jgi:hypothetical protein
MERLNLLTFHDRRRHSDALFLINVFRSFVSIVAVSTVVLFCFVLYYHITNVCVRADSVTDHWLSSSACK